MMNWPSLLVTFHLLIMVIVFSCNLREKSSEAEVLLDFDNTESLVRYANGFDLFEKNGIYKLVIFHPAAHDVTLKNIFLLPAKHQQHSYENNEMIFVTPVDSVALFSATQISAFDKLGILDDIIGVSEASYIMNPFINEGIADGRIKELAGSGNFYVESAMILNPSAIFVSPEKVVESHPLEVTGIPLIPFYDYHETDPLARAEWIKFSAVFFGMYKQADSIFKHIEEQYTFYKSIAEKAMDKPSVFSDKYFNGQWYMPGGKSYVAKLFLDAGSNYLWSDNDLTASFPLDYEVVYDKAADADYWRIVGSYGDSPSYEALKNENELYQHFKAFRNKKVIWCDARNTSYFEKSPLEPHLVLADLIKAFHPELLPGYTPKYYHVLK